MRVEGVTGTDGLTEGVTDGVIETGKDMTEGVIETEPSAPNRVEMWYGVPYRLDDMPARLLQELTDIACGSDMEPQQVSN